MELVDILDTFFMNIALKSSSHEKHCEIYFPTLERETSQKCTTRKRSYLYV